MNLSYPFPFEVRTLFDDFRFCAYCKRNGNGEGGLELHHIWGRVSDSAFNAAVLCKICHGKITGSREEKLFFFGITYRYLMVHKDDNLVRPFRPESRDLSFIEAYWGDFQEFDFSTD